MAQDMGIEPGLMPMLFFRFFGIQLEVSGDMHLQSKREIIDRFGNDGGFGSLMR